MKDLLWVLLVIGAAAVSAVCMVAYVVFMGLVVVGMLIVDGLVGIVGGKRG